MDVEIIASVIQSMKGLFISVWDEHTGSEILKNDSRALEGFHLNSPADNMLSLLQQYVIEEDESVYRVYISKIMRGVASKVAFSPIEEDKLSVAVRLKCGEEGVYHRIECYLEKKNNKELSRIVMIISPMDIEEIYREELAHTITNDKTNVVFTKSSKELLQNNPDENYALIQFDIAKFKAINSVHGEAFGDELLKFIIDSLKVLCNDKQLYVRLTADVFMILTAYKDDNDILAFIHKINDNLTGYKDVNYRLVFGVAKVEDKTERLRVYGDRAAIARQNSKKDALEYIGFYKDGMNQSIIDGKFVEDNIEEALYNGEFVMYLQPKYSIVNNSIVGAEALVRWFQKDRGMIPPDQFIPILEMNGFIKEMDAYIWEEACKTLRRWIDKGIDNIPISVNVSRMHLNNTIFIDILNNLIREYDIPKHLLEIEITESANNVGAIMENIGLLKDAGFTLLMDDFGSGYSSLNTLKDTMFDVVKIDREFLQDFIDSDRGQKIVQHTISMTKAIGLDLVAEGVETLEQAHFLSECGCDTAQGYYYARPMPVSDMEKLLGIE